MKSQAGTRSKRLGVQMGMFMASLIILSAALYGGAELVKGGASSRPGGEETATEAQIDSGIVTDSGPLGVAIAARNISFNVRTIRVRRGADVRVAFANQDPGVLHNVAIYTSRTATNRIFVGEIFAGPRQVEYSFVAPATPGNYFFRCDVHPDQMTGTFIVE